MLDGDIIKYSLTTCGKISRLAEMDWWSPVSGSVLTLPWWSRSSTAAFLFCFRGCWSSSLWSTSTRRGPPCATRRTRTCPGWAARRGGTQLSTRSTAPRRRRRRSSTPSHPRTAAPCRKPSSRAWPTLSARSLTSTGSWWRTPQVAPS